MCIILSNSVGWVGMQEAVRLMRKANSPLDVAERGIRLVEEDPDVHTVGYGGWPNLNCEMELDASIMDGDSLSAGAVGALKGFLHPISVARQVLDRLPNVLLVGEGAARFARESGQERGNLLSDTARKNWQQRVFDHMSAEQRGAYPDVELISLSHLCMDPELERGTTCYLVVDDRGTVVSGISTSGLAWKYPGRLGDSPLIGAGNYADSRFGAAACIGTGEMTIRAGTARSVVLYLKMGMSVEEACYEALSDLRALKGGLLGDVTLFCIDKWCRHFVLCLGEQAVRQYCIWTDGMRFPEQRQAQYVPL